MLDGIYVNHVHYHHTKNVYYWWTHCTGGGDCKGKLSTQSRCIQLWNYLCRDSHREDSISTYSIQED